MSEPRAGEVTAVPAGQQWRVRLRDWTIAAWHRGIEAPARRARDRFDALKPPLVPAVVVAVLAALAAAPATMLGKALKDGCGRANQVLIRLEVAFDAERFASLMPAREHCASAVVGGFSPFGWDTPFAVFYALTLAALYLWVERWRRVPPPDRAGRPLQWRAVELQRTTHLFVVAPLAAGLLDIVGENLPLWIAAKWVARHAATAPPAWMQPLVLLGSIGSVLKWLLLLVSIYGIVAELLRGPRGEVLRRVRFSILAVALGALPLLLIPQGQDVLQRLVEEESPLARALLAVLVLLFTALVVWYCARKLVQFDFGREEALRESGWYGYFAENVPRMLGVAFLVGSGAAFAGAGLARTRYAAVAIGVFGLVAIVRYVLSRREHARRDIRDDGTAADGEPGRAPDRATDGGAAGIWSNRGFLTESVGALLAIALGAFIVWPHGREGGDPAVFHLRLGAWSTLSAAWLFYLYVYYRRWIASVRVNAGKGSHLAKRLATSDATDRRDDDYRGLLVAVLAALAVSGVLFWLFVSRPVPFGRFLGTLWVLALAVANATFLGSLAVWLHRRTRIPVVTLAIVAAALFSVWNENHVVRTEPVQIVDRGRRAPPRETLEQHMESRLQAMPQQPDGAATPVIIVAAAGGGLRAAYWTAATLAAAQDRNPAFAEHVFAISGVSGGSLGAAVFTGLVRDAHRADGTLRCAGEEARPAPLPDGPYSRCVRRFMRDDYLSPVLAKLVAPDLAQRFIPVPVGRFDRSTAMEESWELSYAATTGESTFARGMLDLARDSANRLRVPVLLLNATHVESGRRYVASPFDVRSALSDAPDVVHTLRSDLPLSAAVHNSARFTWVSPAGHLSPMVGEEYGRLVDGGYFEASGLTTAQELYALVKRRMDDTTRGLRKLRPILLYLCNAPVACNRRHVPEDSVAGVPNTSANELLSPPRAVLNALGARGSLSMEQLRRAARHDPGTVFLQLNVCDTLPPATAEGDTSALARSRDLRARAYDRVVSPPLGWLLSRLARDWMDRSLAGPRSGTGCHVENARVLDSLHALVSRSRVAGSPSPVIAATRSPSGRR